MTFKAWYERFPERIATEQAAFARAGLQFTLNQDIRDKTGVIVFEGQVDVGGEAHTLRVFYPSGFPYMRPEVTCAAVTLKRHQNPYGKNLCVIPNEQASWTEADTGAMMVQQAQALLQTIREGETAVADREVDAPEPASTWYRYTPGASLVVLEDPPAMPPGDFGRFTLATRQPYAGILGVQGFLQAIHNGTTNATWQLSQALVPPFLYQEFQGSWIAVTEPPPYLSMPSNEPAEYEAYFNWACSQQKNLRFRLKQQADKQQKIEAFGILYPDEGPERGRFHQNWLVGLRPPNQPGVLLRPIAWTQADQARRLPSLQGLQSKKVLLVGAGALGSPFAAAMARAGLGTLGVVDFDFVDAGPMVRQQYDLRDVSYPKPFATQMRSWEINPRMKVNRHEFMLGGALLDVASRTDPRDPLAEFYEAAKDYDLLVSVTGQTDVDMILNEMGAAASLPRVFAWVVGGAWGGRVFRAQPGAACYECLRHGWEQFPRPQTDLMEMPLFARGCGYPTFTGTGFDAESVANLAVRLAVQTLLAGQEGAYPDTPANLLTWSSRGAEPGEYPTIHHDKVARQEACRTCRMYPQ